MSSPHPWAIRTNARFTITDNITKLQRERRHKLLVLLCMCNDGADDGIERIYEHIVLTYSKTCTIEKDNRKIQRELLRGRRR